MTASELSLRQSHVPGFGNSGLPNIPPLQPGPALKEVNNPSRHRPASAGLALALSFTSACTHVTRHAVCVVYKLEGCGVGKRIRLRYAGGYISH